MDACAIEKALNDVLVARRGAQQALMRFDPATGEPKPYPSHARQWREYNGSAAWLFNPWTGQRRDARDVGSDLQGQLIEAR